MELAIEACVRPIIAETFGAPPDFDLYFSWQLASVEKVKRDARAHGREARVERGRWSPKGVAATKTAHALSKQIRARALTRTSERKKCLESVWKEKKGGRADTSRWEKGGSEI